MNRSHLTAFLWLRWRLIVNQFRRAGAAGAILSVILAALMAVAAVLMLVIGFLIGLIALRTAPAAAVMLVWDGAIVGFLFLWFAGVMSELQRTDAISLDRFLHLPVSPASAFLINFLGSSVSLALVLMLPAMIGLAAGLVLSRGPGMLVLVPLVAAFFLMMTSLAYQFRGWLAAMMQSPRRRQTVIAIVPILFVAATQLPNLWNTVGPGARERREARAEARRTITKLDEDLAAGRITREEYARRRPAPIGNGAANVAAARVVNMVAPPGWLAYGAESAANGRVWPAFAGMLGMALIGTISLTRAYRTTLRVYTGDFSRKRRRSPPAPPRIAAVEPAAAARSGTIIEQRVPWTSERVSAVATSTLRSWTRAPEMKLTLLTPVFMLVVFSRMFTSAATAPELMRPLATTGLAAFVMILGLVGPAGNQFGYDRAGFRAFVLSPIPRRDVLIGRNLALLPFALTMMIAVVALSQWFRPMRMDHVLAVVLQLLPVSLTFCLAANLLSIVSPLTLKPGSGMPAPHQGARSFGHLVFMLVSPLVVGLTLLPLGIEALFTYLNWIEGFPTYLVLSAIQAGVVVPLYLRVVDRQGALLQRRERTILEVVGARTK